MAKWYYKHAEREFGPVEAAELRQRAGIGELLPSDAVRRWDMQTWTPANRVKGLFETASRRASRHQRGKRQRSLRHVQQRLWAKLPLPRCKTPTSESVHQFTRRRALRSKSSKSIGQ